MSNLILNSFCSFLNVNACKIKQGKIKKKYYLAPNRRLLKVSSALNTWGEAVITKVVLVLPPKDSCKILVNFESLKGTWPRFASVNAWIQFPNADKDWLIFLASSKVFPVAPVFPTFYVTNN